MSQFRTRVLLALALGLIAAVSPLNTEAQNLSSITDTSSVLVTSGNWTQITSGSSSCWLVPDGMGHAVPSCSGDLRDTNTKPETRKDDGHGPTLVQVKDTRRHLRSTELAPVGYAGLAKSLGMPAPADEATLLQAISDASLGVYSFAKVDDYLYRQALRHGARYRWVWKPAREADAKAVASSEAAYTDEKGVGLVMDRQYQREVPIRVLREIKTMLGCVPDALFLISDYEVVKPDPFLAISTPDLLMQGKLWIIDQWDEPGFTDKPEPAFPGSSPALVASR